METLLDDLLAYSRAGRQRHPAETVDTAELVRNVIEAVVPPTGFTVNILGTLPQMRVERAPLESVLRNLIGNAIKHHDAPAGVIEISARELEDCRNVVSWEPRASPEYAREASRLPLRPAAHRYRRAH